MDAEITEPEPLAALKSCTDSAPGPDEIPYSVYKKLWDIVGSYIDGSSSVNRINDSLFVPKK